jgi:uncharacterized protein (TIGR02270 family)
MAHQLNRDGTGSIATVVMQHAEDAAALRNTRSVLVRAPHVKLLHLARHDERIAAHLDGLVVAGEMGTALCDDGLASLSRGSVFAAAALAIQRGDGAGVSKLLGLAEAEPTACRSGLVSAFGWVSPSQLRGLTKDLLGSGSAFRRGVGLASCELHGVAPDAAVFASALQDAVAGQRGQALRAAGRLGRLDLRVRCVDALADDDEACRLEAACAALLLGERSKSIGELKVQATAGSTYRTAALAVLLQVLEPHHARIVLKALSASEGDARLLIHGIGIAGDPHFVPWLLAQMEEPPRARIAGEAFSLITGLDLAYLDLELRTPPPDADTGPNDDPNDADVALDEDDSLPWPDATKLHAWWQAHQHEFTAGARWFMGQPLSAAHCAAVLKTGKQRQRILAARHLCLIAPGTLLFNCAAPAWRQQRVLAAMA